jgi:hypothetical protein
MNKVVKPGQTWQTKDQQGIFIVFEIGHGFVAGLLSRYLHIGACEVNMPLEAFSNGTLTLIEDVKDVA